MKNSSRCFAILIALTGGTAHAGSELDSRIDFERAPKNVTWKTETTQPQAKAAEWSVEADSTAPSAKHVLSIRRIHDFTRNVFNLYWSPDIRFANGSLEVAVRANTGDIDQGGGLIWRVRDARNYYLARYNPLERNLRVYTVIDGARRQIAGKEDINLPAGRWWRLRITHHGEDITASLDGVQHIHVKDNRLPDVEGGVGLWAKADAASSFDDLVIKNNRVEKWVKP